MQQRERRERRLRQATSAVARDTPGVVRLSADGQWHDSGLQLKAGESVRLSASGRLFLSKPLEVSVGPRTCIWYRIGDEPIARLPGEDGFALNAAQHALYIASGSVAHGSSREKPIAVDRLYIMRPSHVSGL